MKVYKGIWNISEYLGLSRTISDYLGIYIYIYIYHTYVYIAAARYPPPPLYPHIPSYTRIYPNIPPYTPIYSHILPHTCTYLHIPPYIHIYPPASVVRKCCFFRKSKWTETFCLDFESHPHGSITKPKISPADGLAAHLWKLINKKLHCRQHGGQHGTPNGHISGYKPFPKMRIWHNCS